MASNLTWFKTYREFLKETISLVMLPKVMKLQSRDDCLHHLLGQAGSVPSSEKQHPSFSATHFIRAVQELWLMASAQASHPTDSREITHVSQSYQKPPFVTDWCFQTLIFLQLLLFKKGIEDLVLMKLGYLAKSGNPKAVDSSFSHIKKWEARWKGLSGAQGDWACPG